MQQHADDNNQHCPECLVVFTREDALEQYLHPEHGWEVPICPGDDQDGKGASKRCRIYHADTSDDLYSIERVKEKTLRSSESKHPITK